ncbi:hypothetical protein LP420_30465 [Massilia sp. B-10]|nr:hypothetical protein LP420_30465 [Massilia sp. B-10]
MRENHVETVAVDASGEVWVSYWNMHGLSHFKPDAKGIGKVTHVDQLYCADRRQHLLARLRRGMARSGSAPRKAPSAGTRAASTSSAVAKACPATTPPPIHSGPTAMATSGSAWPAAWPITMPRPNRPPRRCRPRACCACRTAAARI